eukprot:TRINITY_DN602_c0_g1_i2.p1 TRINITY_DN602_c0_g1~~TRINITY_DN602_c0_g1_i2.p1  ORF type:complete len:1203 (+),score=241.33 TRINITY_DN602_c0_g1_i2:74-3682(+)
MRSFFHTMLFGLAYAKQQGECQVRTLDGSCTASSNSMMQTHAIQDRANLATNSFAFMAMPRLVERTEVIKGVRIHFKEVEGTAEADALLQSSTSDEVKTWLLDLPTNWTHDQVHNFNGTLAEANLIDEWEGESDNIIIMKGTAQQVRNFANDEKLPADSSIEQDSPVVMQGGVSIGDILAGEDFAGDLPWGLDRIDDEKGLDNSYDTFPSRAGAGVNVYVLDTGVRVTHAEFEGRAKPAYDVFEGSGPCSETDTSCAADRQGHGTHCAGTVAGKTYGVAKKANIYAAKVLNDQGGGSYTGIIKVMDWVTNNGKRPAVMSMSLGGPGTSRSLQRAVDSAKAAGVTVVVAAGNDNQDACGFSPAFVPNAITVGSMTNQDQKSSFSNYGTCLDIWAPGSDVKSAWKGSDSETNTISGTSMACPHVAGAVALLLAENPEMSVEDVTKQLLDKTVADAISGIPGSPASVNLLLNVIPGDGSPSPSPDPSLEKMKEALEELEKEFEDMVAKVDKVVEIANGGSSNSLMQSSSSQKSTSFQAVRSTQDLLKLMLDDRGLTDVQSQVSASGHMAAVRFTHAGSTWTYKMDPFSVYAPSAEIWAHTANGAQQRKLPKPRSFRAREADNSHGLWANAMLHTDGSVTGLFHVNDSVVRLETLGRDSNNDTALLQIAGAKRFKNPHRVQALNLGQLSSLMQRAGKDVPEMSDPDGSSIPHMPESTDNDAILKGMTDGTLTWTGTKWWPGCYNGDEALYDFKVGAVIDNDAVVDQGSEKARELLEGMFVETSFVYEHQFHTKLSIGYLKIYESTDGAPAYASGCSPVLKLNEFSEQAAQDIPSGMGASHLFTGCGTGSGTVGEAWVGTICRTDGYNTGVDQFHKPSQWLIFAHELGHNFDGSHSFEEGQGSTGGIMDYGDGLLDGAYQFNTKYRKQKMCAKMNAVVGRCGGGYDKAGPAPPPGPPSPPSPPGPPGSPSPSPPGSPSPPAAPAPPKMPALWNVTAGPCTVDKAGCLRSANFIDNSIDSLLDINIYGPNETCTIEVNETQTNILVKHFSTEAGLDILTVNGMDYSGDGNGLEGILPRGTITWKSGDSVQSTGFKLCPEPWKWNTTVGTSCDAKYGIGEQNGLAVAACKDLCATTENCSAVTHYQTNACSLFSDCTIKQEEIAATTYEQISAIPGPPDYRGLKKALEELKEEISVARKEVEKTKKKIG